MKEELDRIAAAYAKRTAAYDPWDPWVLLMQQEVDRYFAAWLRTAGLFPVSDKRVIEIGCGHGQNLLRFIRFGFSPANIVGNELLHSRAIKARSNVPAAVRIVEGNAAELDFPNDSFDVVFQSLVFSSITDMTLRVATSKRMWEMTRPGGGVLWYDLAYDNPRNPDIRGISIGDVRQLFPRATITWNRITLAPPIARSVSKVSIPLYHALRSIPLLRSHIFAWILKTPSTPGE